MEHDAGRALDALVAETVMGYSEVQHVPGPINGSWFGTPPAPCAHGTKVPYYSTDLETAWEVVEHLRVAGWAVECTGFPGDLWVVRLIRDRPHRFVRASAATAPLAICRAALQALAALETEGR